MISAGNPGEVPVVLAGHPDDQISDELALARPAALGALLYVAPPRPAFPLLGLPPSEGSGVRGFEPGRSSTITSNDRIRDWGIA